MKHDANIKLTHLKQEMAKHSSIQPEGLDR